MEDRKREGQGPHPALWSVSPRLAGRPGELTSLSLSFLPCKMGQLMILVEPAVKMEVSLRRLLAR